VIGRDLGKVREGLKRECMNEVQKLLAEME
jgi:hypothetical protein